MSESQAQRTLVKSPPELWAELSDPAALARHLGELGGEIRITRLVPEKTVVWEGERASGTVELKPSGWGTKVTLTVQPQAEEEGADLACGVGAEAPADAQASPVEPAAGDPETPGLVALDDQAPANPPSAQELPAPDERADADAPELPGSAARGAADAPELADPVDGPQAVAVSNQPPSEPSLTSPAAAPPEPPAPKPGFFGRLFRRRRARSAAISQTASDARSEDAATPEAPSAPPVTPSADAATPSADAATPDPPSEDSATPSKAATARDAGPQPAPLALAALWSPVAQEQPSSDVERPPVLEEPPPSIDEPSPLTTPPAALQPSAGDGGKDTAALLSSVLDALGAAHHRPFSRS